MLPLDQRDQEVRQHLIMIEAGARMCADHAKRLAVRATFENKPEVEMAYCEAVLRRALAAIERAQEMYREKPVDS